MMREYKKNSINIKRVEGLKEDKLKGKIVVGEFVDGEEPELCEEMAKMGERIR